MPDDKARFERIAFVASDNEIAQQALADLSAKYDNVAPHEAQAIVALGGDGLMLQTLRRVELTLLGGVFLARATRRGRRVLALLLGRDADLRDDQGRLSFVLENRKV